MRGWPDGLRRTALRATAGALALVATAPLLPASPGFDPGCGSHALAAQDPGSVADDARIRQALESAVAAAPTRAAPYLQLARFEIRAGDVDRAERILRTGLVEAAGDPAVSGLRGALVEILAARRDWDEAARVMEAMDGPAPDSVRATVARLRVNAGLDARDRGDGDGALESFREATRLDPSLLRGWLELAGTELARGRTARARDAAESGLRYHPDDAELRLIRASTLQGRGATAELVSALRDLRAQRPEDTRVALSLAGYLAGTGEVSAALALQDTLLSAPEPPSAVFLHAATFWLENRQADTARVILDRGVDVHPDEASLHALRGYALERLELPAAAAAGYTAAAERTARPAWLRLRAARVLAAAGRGEAAAEHLSFFTTETAPLVASLLAARTAAELGRHEQEGWILRRAALGYADNPWLLEAEARHLESSGDGQAAAEAWRRLAASGSPIAARALDESPSQETLRAAVRGGLDRLARGEQGIASRQAAPGVDAGVLITGRDLEEAWVLERLKADRAAVTPLLESMVFETDWGPAELSRLRDIYPSSVLLARLDSRLALRQGRLARARREVERLLDLQPRAAEVHGLHGEILEAQDDPEAALRSYTRALEIDPAAPGAFSALTRLHGEAGTLDRLLARVRRLRSLSPADSLRVAQEVELLHRLGRLEEARALADSVAGGGGGSEEGGDR